MVCPQCDAETLGVNTSHPWPVLCGDATSRTATDFQKTPDTSKHELLDFYGFRFTPTALRSAMLLVETEDATTFDVEKIGRSLGNPPSIQEALRFSKAVCDWGRGGRVWGNLQRYNPDEGELGRALSQWFDSVRSSSDDEDAIVPGTEIKGLDVSFASKHLRMIDPTRFAVLDDVLHRGLGFAKNPKGYRLFMRLLRDFKAANRISDSVAKIESGIFGLVRPTVRSQ